MAESQATHAFATLLAAGDGGSPVETFTNIAEIRDLTPPTISRTTPEVTHRESPGRFQEYIPGIRDGGEVSMTVNWLPANVSHADMRVQLMADNVAHNYRMTFPSTPASTCTFKAIVTSLSPAAGIDEALSASLTFKITGQPVFA